MNTEILMNVYVDNGKVHVFPLSTIIGAVASGTIALTFDSVNNLIKVRDWNAPAEKVTILLTPEILEKCGFEDKYIVINEDGEERTIWTKGPIVVLSTMEVSEPDLPYEIKHLHQLQNLYFALSGQELNYQP